jgi:hypothetical protein
MWHSSRSCTDAQAAVAVAVEKHLREEMICGSEIKPAAVTQQFRSDALSKAEQSKMFCQSKRFVIANTRH